MLNCLIIDDEPLARKHIESYVDRVPFLKLAGSARNVAGGIAVLENEPVDLLLMDIKMPGTTGIEFLKSRDVYQQVIFITAYPEFALDGFDLEVTDYLMKPVTYERFLKAVEKANAKVGGTENIRTINQQPGHIYVKHGRTYQKIAIADILFVESMLNYVNVVTANAKYTAYSSMKNVEAALPKDIFVRIHKSYLVALPNLTAIGLTEVKVGEHSLPVSRANKDDLLAIALKTGLFIR